MTDIDDDYKFARDNLYKMVEQGDEAMTLLLDFIRESESPRAFEVFATLMKNKAEVTDKLMELQKKKKEVEKADIPALTAPVTTNNLFVGSTAELQKMLGDRMKDINAVPSDD